MEFYDNKSVDVCRIALKMAISSREEEKKLIKEYKLKGIRVAAVDVGGTMPNSRFKFIESALVAAKRNNIIKDEHVHDGAVIGAMREAISQIETNINGLSVGGKIGLARNGEHLGVAIFLSVGILQFNEVITSVAHRSVAVLPDENDFIE
ncbi:HutP family protein [Pseudoleptotrichia goodfellowii]|uniref:Hut operon positive regulatory protein n=2 Tax=Pseudoleptotrichia goodfellowii TaxID=157692 RepID=D0GJM2_9FUSO|nr:HutP family protein [Pseudoleptotrichia goodfellowii]EEY35713.1 HutP [Pseudoleptotrichia goodfellowii F0264]BBM36023.1 HutP family protein [Pseudoleptotrichia goodfellowii]